MPATAIAFAHLRKFAPTALLLASSLLFIASAYKFALIHRPNSNEAWFADAARNLWLHGELKTTIMASKGTWLEGVDRHTYWAMPFDLLAQSIWYRYSGFSLLSMRALAITAGLGLIVAWFLVAARLLKSQLFAATFAILLACDPRLTSLSSNGRMDSMCAFCGVAGLACYLVFRTRSHRIATLLGHTFVALSGLTHPCGAVYAFDLFLLQLWFGGKRSLKEVLPFAVLPYLVLGSAFGVWISRDWDSFLRQFGGNISGLAGEYSGRGRFSVFSQPWLGLKSEFENRYLRVGSGWASLACMWLNFAGFVWLLMRSRLREQRRIRLLFFACAFHFCFFWLLEGLKLSNYLLHLIPLLVLMALLGGRDLLESGTRKICLAVIGLLALNVTALFQNFEADSKSQSMDPVFRILEDRRGSVITAPAEFAFYLGFDGQMQDDHRLGFYTGRKPDLFVTNSWQRDWLEHADKSEPEVAKAIRTALDMDYREIYRNESFVVWRRNR